MSRKRSAARSAGASVHELTDPRAMRALAHPVRIELLHVLAREPKTATQCAEETGESPQSCSYHLRTLGKYGFVERAEPTNGKERPWRKTKGVLNWDADVDPEAARALSAAFLQRDWNLLRAYLADPPPDWPDPLYSQSTLRVTRAEAEELTKKFFDLFEPYFPPNRPDAPEGARNIWFASFGVPADR